MINLLDVNSFAAMTAECIQSGDKIKAREIADSLSKCMADRRDVLARLEAKASEIGSDNAWNRYESADEAYAYGEELGYLIEAMILGDEDYDDLEWQIADIQSKSGQEALYRLERAQW